MDSIPKAEEQLATTSPERLAYSVEEAAGLLGRSQMPRNGERMETIPKPEEPPATTERLAYSIEEAAAMLGVHYFSVYRLIQRGKLKACRALRGKLLVPRTELLKLLKTE